MNEDTGGGRDRRGQSRLHRVRVLAAAVAGIALLVAACGGSGGGSPAAAGSTAYQKALAYAQCLRSHGEPGWPDPNSQGNFRITGANHVQQGSPQFASANKACEHLLPDGGQETAAQQQQALSQALKFVACMRSHGIPDFPDPTVQDGQVNVTLGASGFARNSPQLQSARQACRSLGPGGGP
jgi:hypothetical protein